MSARYSRKCIYVHRIECIRKNEVRWHRRSESSCPRVKLGPGFIFLLSQDAFAAVVFAGTMKHVLNNIENRKEDDYE